VDRNIFNEMGFSPNEIDDDRKAIGAKAHFGIVLLIHSLKVVANFV
jgi:hypothetical protein